MNILLALVLIAVGFILVIGTESFLRMFGGIDFAEKYFRTSGGSRLMYKLIGVGSIFLGFILIFNLHLGAMKWIATNLFGAYIDEDTQQEEVYEVIN